ncbi:hypothetical protein BH09MYX1_BH09MYX1_43500 [soil metagenome]
MKIEPFVTRVGRAEDGDNRFRGYSVDRDLAGRLGVAQTLVLALTGMRLDAEAGAVIDDLTVSILAADPRIWPLKVPRLGATFGSPLVGAAVALLAQESTNVGGGSSGVIARYLVNVARELDDTIDDAAVARVVARDLAAGHKFIGYGVPFRDVDERVTTAERCLAARGRTEHKYWRLARSVERALAAHRPLPLNAAGAMAAALLDLGLAAADVPMLVIILSTPSLYANAVEGAAQKAVMLQRLPDECVDYTGPPARRSPRFGQ